MKNWRTKSLLCFALAIVSMSLGCRASDAQTASTTPTAATTPAAAATNDPFWGTFPAGTDPTEVGRRVIINFLDPSSLSNKSKDAGGKNMKYPEACLVYGSMRFSNTTGDKELLDKLIAKYADIVKENNGENPGTRLNKPTGVDANVCAIVPLEMYLVTGKEEYKDTGKDYADAQFDPQFAYTHFKLNDVPKDILAKEGSAAPAGLSWETRYWVDDMFMITGLQMQAYRATHEKKYLDHAADEMVSYLDKLQQPNGLFFHKDTAQHYWGRGNGWFAVGMAEVLSSMPEDAPQRPRILEGYKKMMAALKKYQAPDGSWHQLVDDEVKNWPESSCTAMFTFGEAMGVKNGWLDAADYKEVAKNGWIATVHFLDKDANMTEVCMGTNTNADPQFYVKRPREVGNPHGQAACIWAAWAMIEDPKK